VCAMEQNDGRDQVIKAMAGKHRQS